MLESSVLVCDLFEVLRYSTGKEMYNSKLISLCKLYYLAKFSLIFFNVHFTILLGHTLFACVERCIVGKEREYRDGPDYHNSQKLSWNLKVFIDAFLVTRGLTFCCLPALTSFVIYHSTEAQEYEMYLFRAMR